MGTATHPLFRAGVSKALGIDYPIMLAGMGGVSASNLVAAVSNAGGLGVIGGAMMSPRHLRAEIRAVRDATDKPFGVDLLAPDPEAIRPHMAVLYEEGVKVFVAGLAIPEAFIGEMHEKDMLVLVMVGKVRHAEKAVHAGADIVVAQGTEAGGHTGLIGGMALIPQVVDAVDVPVMAAGGIVDGRGLVAALALGAQGVVVGTRFIATHEAAAADAYRRTLVESEASATVRTRCYTGKPARAVRNRYTDSWESRGEQIQPFPLQAMHSMSEGVMDYTGRTEADPDRTFMPAGQGIGSIQEIKSAADVFTDLLEGARAVCDSLPLRK